MLSIFAKKGLVIFWSGLLLVTSLVAGKDSTEVVFDPFESSAGDASSSVNNNGATSADFNSSEAGIIDSLSSSQDVGDRGPVIPEIQFTNDDISMAFQIISDATGWSIFPTAEASKAKVSLWAKDIKAEELLNTVVAMAGFIYHRQGSVITVMTYGEYMQHYGLAKKVIGLTYANAVSVATVIKPFLSKLGKSVVHKETNAIILYEADANLEFIAGIIENLDTPAENIVVEVIDIKYADCDKLAKILREVFASKKKDEKNKSLGAKNTTKPTHAKGTKQTESKATKDVAVPDEQVEIYTVIPTNQLVVVGRKSSVQKVKDIIEKVDTPAENVIVEVINLKHVDCDSLAKILKEIVAGKKKETRNKSLGGKDTTIPTRNDGSGQTETANIENIVVPYEPVEIYAGNYVNQLVVVGTESDVQTVRDIVARMDVTSENTIIEIIDIEYANVEELANALQELFPDKENNNKAKRMAKANTPVKAKSSNGSGKIMSKYDDATLNIQRNIDISFMSRANQLIVQGFPSDIERLKTLVKNLDILGESTQLEVIDIEYADVEELANTLQEIFSGGNTDGKTPKTVKPKKSKEAKPSADSGKSKGEDGGIVLSAQRDIGIYFMSHTNQLIVQGLKADIERLKNLVKELDTYREPITKSYHFTYVDAVEVYQGLEGILDIPSRFNTRTTRNSDKRVIRRSGITLITNTNSIILTGPPSMHRIMASIVESTDVATAYERGIIRIYKLDNADLEEIANVITKLLERSEDEEKGKSKQASFSQGPPDSGSETPESSDIAQTGKVIPKIETKVAISTSTNSIIVQATARQHRELEKLIVELDRRRKQVLIEAMIIEVATMDNLDIGVELNNAGVDGFAFTSFGLTSIVPTTGAREIIVGPGGTAAVLRPDKIQAVLQAFKSSGNAKITSAPQILVNDNAVGFINSVVEEPFTQANVAGDTIVTESFAGFIEAGTQFAITPHISEKDYLRVEYEITLNSFGTGPAGGSIPPPRNTTSIKSEATVPNGSTIVVGGLQNVDESDSIDKVPLLGDIPLIGFAFQKAKSRKQYKTTYLFITPTIMERDDFSDLKDVSRKVAQEIENNAHGKTTLDKETNDNE